MAENYEINFDELPEFEEIITKEDVLAAGGGSAPIGKLLINCYKITGKRMDYMKPPCLGTTLHFRVKRVIEIAIDSLSETQKDTFKDRILPGQPNIFLEKNEGEFWAGTMTKDDICMPSAGEPDWRKNRRVNIGKSLELIDDNGGTLTKAKIKSLLNTDFIINTQMKFDKNPATKEYNVPTEYSQVKMFGGYEAVPYDSQGNAKPSKTETATPDISIDDI